MFKHQIHPTSCNFHPPSFVLKHQSPFKNGSLEDDQTSLLTFESKQGQFSRDAPSVNRETNLFQTEDFSSILEGMHSLKLTFSHMNIGRDSKGNSSSNH